MKANPAWITIAAFATLAAASAARAETSDESLGNRAESALQSLVSLPNDASIVPRSDAWLVFENPSLDNRGAAARISKVVRYKSYLFVYDQFGHDPHLIPYFTDSGAESDLRAIEAGQSVDVSDCMTGPIVSRTRSEDGYCTYFTVQVSMSCGVFNTVDLNSLKDVSNYDMTDTTATPIVRHDMRCPSRQAKDL